MGDAITCPNCGGIIGGAAEEGYPCHCHGGPAGSSGDTAALAAPPVKKKACCQCGVDLAGKKRYHDSLGYWCEACHSRDKKKSQPQGTPCDGCSTPTPPEKLSDYDGLKLCPKCIRFRRESAKKKIRTRVSSEAQRQHEMQRLIIMLAVLLLLGVLAIYQWVL